MSLLIGEKGLDVVIRDAEGETRHEHIIYDKQAGSVASGVEEAVYAHPVMVKPFRKVDLVVQTGRYFVVPPEVASDEAALDALGDVFPSDKGREGRFVSGVDERNSVVTYIDRSLAAFLLRTYDGSKLTSHISVLARYFGLKARRGNTSKVYAYVREGMVDVLSYNATGLYGATSKSVSGAEDAAYFILAVGEAMGMDFGADEVFLVAEPAMRSELFGTLRRFVKNVLPAILPIESINVPLSVGVVSLLD